MSLNVSMIVIGDEILNGRTKDLNASWLSSFLFSTGLNLQSVRFIKDDKKDINQALSASLSESDIVITSGGIGPTVDDKTKNCLAEFFGKKIVERQDVAEIVTQNYAQFGRLWTAKHNKYHYFPEDFTATNNPRGLAPGLVYFEANQKKLVLSGPGVPREFTEIVSIEFLPLIKKYFSDRFLTNFQTVIRTNRIPEEKIFFELCPNLWNQLESFGKVSSLPHTIGIDIVVSYQGDEATHIDKQSKIKSLIESTPLASYVWQYGNQVLNEMALNLAIKNNWTFSFAESCTGGLVASKITDLSGSSKAFIGGVVCYSNQSKIDLIGVKEESLKHFGAVSEQVAKEMAIGVRNRFGTDYAISLTGIAGPGGETAEKPAGLVYIGFSTKEHSGALKFLFPGDRVRRKDRFSDMALLILVMLMENKKLDGF